MVLWPFAMQVVVAVALYLSMQSWLHALRRADTAEEMAQAQRREIDLKRDP